MQSALNKNTIVQFNNYFCQWSQTVINDLLPILMQEDLEGKYTTMLFSQDYIAPRIIDRLLRAYGHKLLKKISEQQTSFSSSRCPASCRAALYEFLEFQIEGKEMRPFDPNSTTHFSPAISDIDKVIKMINQMHKLIAKHNGNLALALEEVLKMQTVHEQEIYLAKKQSALANSNQSKNNPTPEKSKKKPKKLPTSTQKNEEEKAVTITIDPNNEIKCAFADVHGKKSGNNSLSTTPTAEIKAPAKETEEPKPSTTETVVVSLTTKAEKPSKKTKITKTKKPTKSTTTAEIKAPAKETEKPKPSTTETAVVSLTTKAEEPTEKTKITKTKKSTKSTTTAETKAPAKKTEEPKPSIGEFPNKRGAKKNKGPKLMNTTVVSPITKTKKPTEEPKASIVEFPNKEAFVIRFKDVESINAFTEIFGAENLTPLNAFNSNLEGSPAITIPISSLDQRTFAFIGYLVDIFEAKLLCTGNYKVAIEAVRMFSNQKKSGSQNVSSVTTNTHDEGNTGIRTDTISFFNASSLKVSNAEPLHHVSDLKLDCWGRSLASNAEPENTHVNTHNEGNIGRRTDTISFFKAPSLKVSNAEPRHHVSDLKFDCWGKPLVSYAEPENTHVNTHNEGNTGTYTISFNDKNKAAFFKSTVPNLLASDRGNNGEYIMVVGKGGLDEDTLTALVNDCGGKLE